MNDQQLPELLEAHWPREQVLALFDDLAAGASIQHVQLRTKSSDSTADLATAREAFSANQALAVQVRYHFDGEDWSDTIMAGTETCKIIRNRLPTLP